MLNEGGGGHSDLTSALRGGFQNLMSAYKGGRGVKKPQKYAYVIFESPLIVILKEKYYIVNKIKHTFL